jgi:hypothetical protein
VRACDSRLSPHGCKIRRAINNQPDETMDGRLLPGSYYHLYNRGNNREPIFLDARNFTYFLALEPEAHLSGG